MVLAFLVGLGTLVATSVVSAIVATRVPLGDPFVTALVGCGITVLSVVVTMHASRVRDRGLPRREQRAYRARVGGAALSGHQQTMLALDAQSDYQIGGWNSSLEYLPAAVLLAAGTGPAPRRGFMTLSPLAERDLRVNLDRQHRIVTAQDALLWAADALDSESLTVRVRALLDEEQETGLLPRLASLTGRDERELRAALKGETGASPLCGADAQRVIAVIRECYMAGVVDEETAWEVIERAARSALLGCEDWEDYWRSVRLGRALLTDALEPVLDFDSSLAGLRTSAWPAAAILRGSDPFRTGAIRPIA